MNPYSKGFSIERHVADKVDAERGIGRTAYNALSRKKGASAKKAVEDLGFKSSLIDPETARSILKNCR